MAKQLLIVIGVGVLCGVGAGLVWGRLVGASLGILVAVVGATVAVLRRNRKDLGELERGYVPGAVDRALGNADRP
jgi:uncharacterized membrane protein YccC